MPFYDKAPVKKKQIFQKKEDAFHKPSRKSETRFSDRNQDTRTEYVGGKKALPEKQTINRKPQQRTRSQAESKRRYPDRTPESYPNRRMDSHSYFTENNHEEKILQVEDNAFSEDNILCGRNPIREALKADRDIEKILVQKGTLTGSAREIIQDARAKKIMVQEVDKRRLDEITPNHQGLIAIASAFQYADIDEILESAREKNEDPFLIVLDGITDPHNLGAIIRTAECAGAHGIIIPQHRSVGLLPSVLKAAAGAVEYIKIAKVTNLNRTIDDLKKRGIWFYAVDMNGEDYSSVDFQGATALVIGAEGEGISRLTLSKCDASVSIPLKGHIDSLNASVAAGIMMYRVLSCRTNRR